MTQKAAKSNTTANAAAAFELPESVRDLAEKSLDQSREAYGKFKGAAEEAATLIEDQAQAVSDTTTALNLKALTFAEANVNSAFELARKLLATKDLGEAVELQLAFARKQAETLGGQAKEFGELTNKAATDATKPYKAQMDKTISEFKNVLPS